ALPTTRRSRSRSPSSPDRCPVRPWMWYTDMALRRSRRRLPMLSAAVILALGACSTSSQSTPSTPSASSTPSVPSVTSTPQRSPSTASVDAFAPAGFVALSDVDPSIQQDIRYATDHNFVGRRIVGYLQPLCILTRQAADSLHRVQAAARARGYGLKVYDCYRPQRAVDDFVRWARNMADQRMKGEFYPRVDKSALFE